MSCWFGLVEAWVKTASWNCASTVVEIDVLDQQHRALPDAPTSTCGSSWSDRPAAGPGGDRGSAAPRAASHPRGSRPARAAAPRMRRTLAGSRSHASMSPAAPIAVRGRRKGEKRAKPNHASSHRKIRSGLIARHSSMTRRTLYMCPSKVQLVSSSIRTRSSRPSARSASSARLIVCERHGAVHRVFRHRERLDVERLRAAQHHAVVVRLVAVAVDDHDVAGRQAAPAPPSCSRSRCRW